MATSKAATVEDYLDELSDDRRKAIAAVRKIILKNLPKGYVETMEWGMISYQIPLKTYPETYNKRPLMYAALASQKNYMSVYLCNVYANKASEKWFKDAFKKSGKKLDMGKSCVHFKTLDDLPLDVIGETIAMTPVKEFIRLYEASRKK
jgi:hypothetical protein